MINHRYWHPMKKPLQVHLYMHFPVSVFIQFWDTHWNISIGKAVPCNFLCLSFLLELFLYTLCDYIGKTVDILATVWLNVCIWFLTFQSVISSSHVKELTSRHILLVLVVKPTVLVKYLVTHLGNLTVRIQRT